MSNILVAVLALSVTTSSLAYAAAPIRDLPTAAKCKALESHNFSVVQDAPTQVTEAKLVEAIHDLPSYCRVRGYVAPQVGFELRLPLAEWNGKFIEIGCGGHCGLLLSSYSAAGHDCDGSLRKGYACIASDAGHKGTEYDGLWGYHNLQAKLDWGYRAPHVTALAGRAITEYFYREAAKKSYFWGCSTGGRQALQEAQRFPWDFDGIIAGAPPVNLSTLYLTFAWGILATHDKEGKPLLDKTELRLITDAAVEKCDLDDGVKDGIISDPRRCPFDPTVLTCKANQTHSCLTPLQVDAVKKVYAGPMTSDGVKLSLGGPMPGSEYGHAGGDSRGDWSVAYLGVNDAQADYEPLVVAGLQYLFFLPELGAGWKLSDFDFNRDYKRMGTMESLYDSSNPDLRKFEAAGGKLLSYQGTNDNSVLPQITEDYYETAERTMGGRDITQSFFRLFVLPGVEHCGGGDGADTVDYLSALENWVEHGKAPDRLIAAHIKNRNTHEEPQFPLDQNLIQFTRPVYPYPIKAKYKGQGDPNDAANFDPYGR